MTETRLDTAEGNAPQRQDSSDAVAQMAAAARLANEPEDFVSRPGPQPAGSGGAAAQMAAAAGHAGEDGLTTQSDEWERLAAEMPNRDVYVPLVDPMFDTGKRFVLATLERPEMEAADKEGKGKAVRLSFKMEEEMTSTDGVQKSPGYIVKPFPYILVPIVGGNKQRSEIGQRELGKLLICTGLASKSEALNVGQITSRIGKLTGRKVGVKFAVKKSTTQRDPETGLARINQNLFFASAEAAKVNEGGEAGEGSPDGGEVPNY